MGLSVYQDPGLLFEVRAETLSCQARHVQGSNKASMTQQQCSWGGQAARHPAHTSSTASASSPPGTVQNLSSLGQSSLTSPGGDNRAQTLSAADT